MQHAGRMLIDLRPVGAAALTLATVSGLYLLGWLAVRVRPRRNPNVPHTPQGRFLSLELRDGLVLVWLCYDVVIHCFSIMGFLVSIAPCLPDKSPHMPVETPPGKTPIQIWLIWHSIRLQDGHWRFVPTFARWSEVVIVVLSLWSVAMCTKMTTERHQWLIALSVMELYLVFSGFARFKPQSLAGLSSEDKAAAFWRWQAFFLFNSLWVLIPSGIIWRSVRAMRERAQGIRLHDEARVSA